MNKTDKPKISAKMSHFYQKFNVSFYSKRCKILTCNGTSISIINIKQPEHAETLINQNMSSHYQYHQVKSINLRWTSPLLLLHGVL